MTLVDGVMFSNNTPFLITTSRGIKLIAVEHIPTCTAKNLDKSIKTIMCLYLCGNMIVQTILMDM